VRQFVFGNVSSHGRRFDQFIAWKAKRKSHSIVPPWEEASGHVVIYPAPAKGHRLVFTVGSGLPRLEVSDSASRQRHPYVHAAKRASLPKAWPQVSGLKEGELPAVPGSHPQHPGSRLAGRGGSPADGNHHCPGTKLCRKRRKALGGYAACSHHAELTLTLHIIYLWMSLSGVPRALAAGNLSFYQENLFPLKNKRHQFTVPWPRRRGKDKVPRSGRC